MASVSDLFFCVLKTLKNVENYRKNNCFHFTFAILKIVGEIVKDCTLKTEVANSLSRDFFKISCFFKHWLMNSYTSCSSIRTILQRLTC